MIWLSLESNAIAAFLTMALEKKYSLKAINRLMSDADTVRYMFNGKIPLSLTIEIRVTETTTPKKLKQIFFILHSSYIYITVLGWVRNK
jgi:hypothetical protein